jgi:pimeloyl-ACP methyl ester carboxylesterase
VTASLDHWRTTGTRFDWRGRNIFTRTGGRADGPAVLLIHGFPTASWDWAPLWALMESDHRLLTLDMLGFGFSAKPVLDAYPIGDQADLFVDFLAAHQVDRCHVIAHDYGDTVAQELLARSNARQLPCQLASVTLLNGGIFPEAHRPLLIQRLLSSPFGPLAARLSSRTSMAMSMRRIFGSGRPPTDEELDGFWTLITANEGRRALPVVSRYRLERRRLRERWVNALIHTRVPLRLIVGLEDPIAGHATAQRYRELVPAPDVVPLPGAGHYPQMEAPDKVMSAWARGRRDAR